MFNFSFGIGGVLFLAGILTYWLAPRIGPNPIFGMRVGYAYASRDIWDRTNRLAGILFILVGAALVLAGLLLPLLNVSDRDGMPWLTGGMMVGLLGGTLGLTLYARKLAQGTGAAREVEPVEFRWMYLAPVVVTFVLLILVALISYPSLPAERLATHFNINDQPDGWMTRDAFLLSFLGLAGIFVLFNLFVVFVATREPLIAFGRWGARWRLDPARGLIYTGIALALTNLIFIAVLWDIAVYNTSGAHAFPLSLFSWLVIPLVVLLVGLFFVLARRQD